MKFATSCFPLATLVFAIIAPRSEVRGAFSPREEALLAHLIAECDILSRNSPREDPTLPVASDINIAPFRFRGINEQTQVVSLILALEVTWQHPCVRWDKENASSLGTGIDAVQVKADQSWTPRLVFASAINSQDEITQLTESNYVLFFGSGTCMISIWTKLDAYCSLNLKKFPFDVQKCSFDIELWNSIEVEYFLPKPNDTMKYPLPPDFTSPSDFWKTESYSYKVLNYSLTPDRSFSRASYQFAFRRIPQLDMVTVFYPSFSLVLLLFGSGFIPAKSPDRSVFCITVMLSFSVAQQSVSEKIPKSADIPYALVFLSTQMAIGVVCTLYSLAMCGLANMDPKARSVVTDRISIIKIDIIFYSVIVFVAFVSDLTILCLMIS